MVTLIEKQKRGFAEFFEQLSRTILLLLFSSFTGNGQKVFYINYSAEKDLLDRAPVLNFVSSLHVSLPRGFDNLSLILYLVSFVMPAKLDQVNAFENILNRF